MHVTSKEVDDNGKHILTSVLEADGPFALVSENGALSASVVSVVRTASGGIELKVAVAITEPLPVAVLSADDQAIAYLASKGKTGEEAKSALKAYGAERILAQKSNDDAEKQSDLDKELAALLK